MAEVLITLGIIGIVAAMTLPALIQKQNERATVTKVKKFYTVLSQAYLMAKNDNGDADIWDYGDASASITYTENSNRAFFKYIKPYLKIIKDCGTTSACTPDSIRKLNNQAGGSGYQGYYAVTLADGANLYMRTNKANCIDPGGDANVCATFIYDLNGKKEPNSFGKDMFIFNIKKDAVYPALTDDCYLNDMGWGCSAYILQHDSMKYPKSR